MKWSAIIIAGWGAALSVSAMQSALPASWWFDAGAVRVADTTTEDTCPAMEFDREIPREFYGEWIVTIMRETAGGGFATYRTYSGKNDYRPENDLPDDIDLCWWTWRETLPLIEGRYRVHTLWKLHVDGGIRHVRRKSNVFAVSALE